MYFTIPLICMLSTSALALPSYLESRQQLFSYNGPLGPAQKCPKTSDIAGAPPNFPNYACIPWSTDAEWIGINLFLSNSTALQVYSDAQCADRISFIEWPQSMGQGNDEFCAEQKENGGAGSWKAVMYTVP